MNIIGARFIGWGGGACNCVLYLQGRLVGHASQLVGVMIIAESAKLFWICAGRGFLTWEGTLGMEYITLFEGYIMHWSKSCCVFCISAAPNLNVACQTKCMGRPSVMVAIVRNIIPSQKAPTSMTAFQKSHWIHRLSAFSCTPPPLHMLIFTFRSATVPVRLTMIGRRTLVHEAYEILSCLFHCTLKIRTFTSKQSPPQEEKTHCSRHLHKSLKRHTPSLSCD